MVKKRKNGNTEVEADVPEEEVQRYELPAGYNKRNTSDIVGFWNSEKGPIHFIPITVKAFDSNIEEVKSSLLIIGKAVDVVHCFDKEHERIECKAGDTIGVWYSPGMNEIKKLADVRVFMFYTGRQDTGKPKPMKTFEVASQKEGNPLMVSEDHRKKSLHTVLPFESKVRRNSVPQGDDDENFKEDTSFP